MNASDKDTEYWKEWKKNKNPQTLSTLLKQVKPIIHKATMINQGSLSPAVVEAEAKLQAVKAFESYNPNKGVKLSTHLTNYMQKVNRLNYKYQEIYSVPEHRRIKFTSFEQARERLHDLYGREPTDQELADELRWSTSEVNRFRLENRKELSDSQPYSSDIHKNDTRDKTLLSYVYNDLSPQQKPIFEHTIGYNNQPVYNNSQIRKKFDLTQGQLSYVKSKFKNMIKDAFGMGSSN